MYLTGHLWPVSLFPDDSFPQLGNITGFETRRGLWVRVRGVRVGVAKLIPPPNPYPQDGSRVLAILPAGLARAPFFFSTVSCN